MPCRRRWRRSTKRANQVALPTWTAAQATYAAARRSPALVGAYLWPMQGKFADVEADLPVLADAP